MQKENQRVVITKRLLKDGIICLLNQKNITEISVCELCAAAGINRTTFYRHYQTPHDVLLEIEMDFIKEIHEFPLPSAEIQDLKHYAARLCAYIYDRRETVKLFIRNNTDSDFLLLFQKFSDKFLASKQVMYMGKPISPVTLRLMQTFFSYGSFAMVKQWLMEDLPLSPEDVAEMILCPFNRELSFV